AVADQPACLVPTAEIVAALAIREEPEATVLERVQLEELAASDVLDRDQGAARRRRLTLDPLVLAADLPAGAQLRLPDGHHAAVSTSDIAAGSFFIDAATASAWRMTRSTLPPASLARLASDQPRRISSAKTRG